MLRKTKLIVTLGPATETQEMIGKLIDGGFLSRHPKRVLCRGMADTHDHPESKRFVSRGGLKMDHALDVFGVDVTGFACVDLGCSTGGFTDCLLQRGAKSVLSIDTGYGVIDYKLRVDNRVTVRERANALHTEPVSAKELADLVVIDLGWTPQSKAIPAALPWLKSSEGTMIITLIKPHYEKSAKDRSRSGEGGLLDHDEAEAIARTTLDEMAALGVTAHGFEKSPIVGSKSARKGKGNAEWLALLRRS